jgi:hypothetical protein
MPFSSVQADSMVVATMREQTGESQRRMEVAHLVEMALRW